MIRTQEQQLYTGITTDVQRRWKEHCSGRGAKFFRTQKPKTIAYLENSSTRSQASKREFQLKQMSKKSKEQLVSTSFDQTQSLVTRLGMMLEVELTSRASTSVELGHADT